MVDSRRFSALVFCFTAACAGSHDKPNGEGSLTDEEIARARSLPHHSTAQVGVEGAGPYDDGNFFGAVVAVKQGDELFFTISTHDQQGRGALARVNISRIEATRLGEDGFLIIRPSDEWSWIYENRGTVTLQGDESGEFGGQVRDFEVRLLDDGSFAATLAAVPLSRLDSESQSVREGSDIVVSAVGRMLGSCFIVDADGSMLADLSSTDPFCTTTAGL